MSDHQFYRVCRIPELDNLEVIDVAFGAGHIPSHFNQTYAFGVVTEGAEAIGHVGGHDIAVPGQVILLSPRELHSMQSVNQSGWRNLVIYPSPALLGDLLDDPGIELREVQGPIVSDPLLARAILEAAEILISAASITRKKAALRQLARQVFDNHGRTKYLDPAAARQIACIRRAMKHIACYPDENVSLNDLAEIAGCSSFQLIETFNRWMGLPPHKYHIQVRIAIAKRLLQECRSIADIAMECGFFDQSHFNRHFKRYVGVAPRNYQKAEPLQALN